MSTQSDNPVQAAGVPEGGAGGPRARRSWRPPTVLRSTQAYLCLVLVLVIIGFSVLRPEAFASGTNARNVIVDLSALLIIAVATTFVMVAGGFDLSVGSVLVFSSVVAAKFMQALGTDNAGTVALGLVCALLAGTAWGIFNGLCITKLGVPGIVTTLGSLGAALGLANLMTGGNNISDVPVTLITFGLQDFLSFGWVVWTSAAFALIGGLVLALTRFGRHTYVIGSNAEAARRAGINVDRHMILLYGLNGFAAGLAGFLLLVRFASVTVSGHGSDMLTVITGVVLGGTSLFGGVGTVFGTVIGSAIPATLNNGFIIIDVPPFWQQVVTGFILIVSVYVDQRRRAARNKR